MAGGIMSDWAIECEGLTRDYGTRRAVWDLTLRVPRGCVFALLGRNGCGKTTTIKLLMGLLRPTRGACRVLGAPSPNLPEQVRERVGYLAEGHPLPRLWRVRQLESFTRAFYRKWDAALFARSLERFEIDPARRVWTLSRGQRGLVALALVVAAGPELVVLDDPSIGLDAVIRRKFLESMIELIQREGRTILFASHHLADVERVADRIGILEDGVLRVDCPVDEFLSRVRRVEFSGGPVSLNGFPGLLEFERRGDRAVMSGVDPDAAALEKLGARDIEEVSLNLEEAFVAYAGRRKGV
jgi:ABC-2 type transport system ATP-binding protein